jgi:hypothetical protein
MSYKQYYCSEEQGMRLRSGKVINCFTTSTLARELKQAISYSYRSYKPNGEYTNIINCLSLQIILSVLEKYAEPIVNNSWLFEFNKSILIKLPQLADGVKQKATKIGEICTCRDFYPCFKRSHINKTLIKLSSQNHTNAESINRLETLYNHFENARIYNERKTMHALIHLVNKYNARIIMSYL